MPFNMRSSRGAHKKEISRYKDRRILVLVVRERVGYDSRMAEEKNPAAVALGKLGGAKGGKARAKKLTPEQRSEIARKAAKARWAKKRQREESS